MGAYASQSLTIGNTPVGFDKNILSHRGKYIPATVIFIVEDTSIRLSSSTEVNNTTGLLAEVGQKVTITGETDIENVKMVSTNLTQSAKIFAEIFNDLT